MSLFGQKCARCGQRRREVDDENPNCAACQEELRVKLEAASEAQRACPIDGALMTKEVAHMIVIDRCPACKGVWLDAGELDRIKDEVAAKTVSALIPTVPYVARGRRGRVAAAVGELAADRVVAAVKHARDAVRGEGAVDAVVHLSG
jgi:hypothetical protein